MKWDGIRVRDSNAVSPIIAVMLMLAITVVLAATVYVVLSSYASSTGQTPIYMGVWSQREGGNYSIRVISISPTTISTSAVTLTILDANGNVLLPGTRLSDLSQFRDSDPLGTISVGDYIWLSTSAYPDNGIVILASEHQLIYEAELP